MAIARRMSRRGTSVFVRVGGDRGAGALGARPSYLRGRWFMPRMGGKVDHFWRRLPMGAVHTNTIEASGASLSAVSSARYKGRT
jgi:hypothetical protein